jgi:hypothetical protein
MCQTNNEEETLLSAFQVAMGGGTLTYITVIINQLFPLKEGM